MYNFYYLCHLNIFFIHNLNRLYFICSSLFFILYFLFGVFRLLFLFIKLFNLELYFSLNRIKKIPVSDSLYDISCKISFSIKFNDLNNMSEFFIFTNFCLFLFIIFISYKRSSILAQTHCKCSISSEFCLK